MDNPANKAPEVVQRTVAYDLEEIYKKYFPLVLVKVRTTMGWYFEEAEDLTNEVFRITIRNIKEGRFKREASLGTYIYAITRNQLSNYIRHNSRFKEVTLKPHIPASSRPGDHLEREERKTLLAKAISSLKPHHQKVIYMRYYEGVRVSEIAKGMGIPPKKVSELLNYGLKKLRASLQNKIP